MYADFISLGYSLIFDQGIIYKCRERMPLAILGKCSLEDTFGRHLPPTIEEYRKFIQSKAVNDDDGDGSSPVLGVVVPRNLNTEGGIAPTTAASPTAPITAATPADPSNPAAPAVTGPVPSSKVSFEGGGEFDGVSDMDKFEMPQYISDHDYEELYVTQLRKKLPQGFIQFMDQYALESSDCMVEKTINLNYYNTSYDDQQAQEQKKILQIAKGLIARLDAYKHAKSVKKYKTKLLQLNW
jgi:hypothetical protein